MAKKAYHKDDLKKNYPSQHVVAEESHTNKTLPETQHLFPAFAPWPASHHSL